MGAFELKIKKGGASKGFNKLFATGKQAVQKYKKYQKDKEMKELDDDYNEVTKEKNMLKPQPRFKREISGINLGVKRR